MGVGEGNALGVAVGVGAGASVGEATRVEVGDGATSRAGVRVGSIVGVGALRQAKAASARATARPVHSGKRGIAQKPPVDHT